MRGVRAALLLAVALSTSLVSTGLATAPAQATTTATIRPSLSPDRPGAETAFTLTLGFNGEGKMVPSPVRSSVVHLPAGLGINLSGVRTCSLGRLHSEGPSACPAGSLIGRGHALMEAQLGALVITEDATLQAFRGPNRGGRPVIEISGQGLTPLVERITFSGVLLSDHAPYGSKLAMSIPPIPTVPTEPDASTVKFSVTFGAAAGSGHHGGSITVPGHCPSGGFPFAADFKFADGSATSASAAATCP
jgi:hypothetical protein